MKEDVLCGLLCVLPLARVGVMHFVEEEMVERHALAVAWDEEWRKWIWKVEEAQHHHAMAQPAE
jgi:hypothetical protein